MYGWIVRLTIARGALGRENPASVALDVGRTAPAPARLDTLAGVK